MHLSDFIPDPELLITLHAEELGIRMLPWLESWPSFLSFQLSEVIANAMGGKCHPFAGGRGYPTQYREEISDAISEAWAWLHGVALLVPNVRYSEGVSKLSREAKRLAREPDVRRAMAAKRISKSALHHSIRDTVWPLYQRGEYELAVVAAMKEVEVRIRAAGGYGNGDYGKDMVARAFNAKNGPLRNESALPPEQEAMHLLMTGAFGLYRNPPSHRYIGLEDPDEAAEIVGLASHLLRLVDRAKQGV